MTTTGSAGATIGFTTLGPTLRGLDASTRLDD
jgi:hypothetical protein